MGSAIRVAVIGCGYWGKNLVRNFSEQGVLYAVCDEKKVVAKEMAETYDVKALTFNEVIESNVDAVVIASPASKHAEHVKQSLLAGKHVFVEKPIAISVKDAEELCLIANKVNKKLMVGHLLQYHPAYQKLKQLVLGNKLGKLQYIYSNRLSLGKIRTEENVLWSFAPHDISMVLGIVDSEPAQVWSSGSSFFDKEIEDTATLHLLFKNGLKAHVFASWFHPYKEQRFVVIGDKSIAVFDDCLPWDKKLQLYNHKVKWENSFPVIEKSNPIPVDLTEVEPLKNECQHFLNSIIENKNPLTSGEEGLKVLRVLDAAEISLKKKGSVNLELKDNSYFVHETAIVDSGCVVGAGTKIWHFSHILKGTKIGENCVIGQNVMIGPDVVVGARCKIQNNVSLYNGVVLEDGVFCGPSCVFTNVNNPRSEIERKDEFRKTYVRKGVTIGANATIVCGVELGKYSFVGAGAVVTKNVKPHALVVGNPARQIGWMSHSGNRLGEDLLCPLENRKYRLNSDNELEEVIS